MSIRANSYGSVAEIAALARRYTNAGAFDATTRPMLAEVEKLIDRVSSLVNVLLAEEGFTIPVSQTDAKLAIDDFVTAQVVQLCHAANGAGPLASGSDELRDGKTPFAIITEEASAFINDHAAGLEALGAARVSSLTTGLACRTIDDAGEEIVPFFQRKQLGNVVTDWDP